MTSPKPTRTAALIVAAGCLVLAACPARRAGPVPVAPPKPLASGVGVESVVLHKEDVKDLAAGDVLQLPYILWGGDVATFLANGGESTREGSIFAKHGLKLNLVRGD